MNLCYRKNYLFQFSFPVCVLYIIILKMYIFSTKLISQQLNIIQLEHKINYHETKEIVRTHSLCHKFYQLNNNQVSWILKSNSMIFLMCFSLIQVEKVVQIYMHKGLKVKLLVRFTDFVLPNSNVNICFPRKPLSTSNNKMMSLYWGKNKIPKEAGTFQVH